MSESIRNHRRLLVAVVFILCGASLVSAQALSFKGKIVFAQGDKQKNISHIFLLDGSSLMAKQLTRSGRNGWPEWAPAGKQIVFASSGRNHKNREIYLMAADGGSQVRLTDTEKGNSSDPHWSEDSRQIYFMSGNKGIIQENIIDLDLCRIDGITGTKAAPKLIGCKSLLFEEDRKADVVKKYEAKLKELRLLAERESGLFQIFPSPDGRYIILRFHKDGRLELYDVVNKKVKEFKVKYSGLPAWSKDGKKIACNEGAGSEENLVVYDMEKDNYDKIKFDVGPDLGCGGKLSWSRDSKQLVYSCATPFSEKEDSWLYIIDLQTKKSTKLIKGNSPDWN